MRGALHLTYGQLGLLIAVPLLVGGLIELPLGLLAGQGRRRHLIVLAGGLLVTAALAAVAAAGSFVTVLLALVLFFPASGAFAGLTQAALMDAAPGKRQRQMARWNLAGSSGALSGPLMLAALLAAGATWRSGYLLLAAVAGATLIAAALAGPSRADPRRAAPGGSGGRGGSGGEDGGGRGGSGGGDGGGEAGRRPVGRAALSALREGEVARWLVLLQISDLLLDVLTGFIGIYLVDVAHASPAQAALGVAIRLGAGLIGDVLFVALSGRIGGRAVLRASALAAGLLYPAFLLVPALPAKFIFLAALSVATACWYPVLQAGLYDSLPGRSGIAVFLSSAAGLAGAAGPLAAGFIAQSSGVTAALGCLAIAPVVIFCLSAAKRAGR